MRLLSHSLTVILASTLLAGCSSSSSSPGGGTTGGGSQPTAASKGAPSAKSGTPTASPDEQIIALIAEYSKLSDKDKIGEAGDKIIQQAKAVKGDVSNKMKEQLAGWETGHNLMKMGGAIKIDTPKIELPKIDTPKIDFPKIELPKLDTPKADSTKNPEKIDLPKLELPKISPEKLDLPKLELPK